MGKEIERVSADLPQETQQWEEFAQLIREKTEQIRQEFGDAPPSYVFRREGAGGDEWDYVREDFFEEALDKHCPDWSYGKPEVQVLGPPQGFPKPVVVVSNALSFTIAGIRRTVGAVGEKHVEFTSQKGSALNQDGKPLQIVTTVQGAAKSADTDCFKRCCVRALRLASNIYRKKDAEHYALHRLTEKDIEVVRDRIDKINRALETAKQLSAMKLKTCRNALEQALQNPEAADRVEVLSIVTTAMEVINANQGR